MISVALIEDNRLVREGIAALLSQAPDLRVVAAESSADPSLLRAANPAVVLLDFGLRNRDTLRLAEQVKHGLPESKVIVMEPLPMPEDIVELVNAGVSGFLMKDATFEDLVQTIRSVAEGAHVLPAQMTGALFSRIEREPAATSPSREPGSALLTARQHEVVKLIAEGLGNKDIGERLRIATHTVKRHVRNILKKLNLRTRLQVAIYAHTGAAPRSSAKVL